MQYLLTQKELDELVPKKELEDLREAHKVLWKHFCARANPVCRGNELGDTRCDNCPISFLTLIGMTAIQREAKVTPVPKDIANLVCPRRQDYSK